MLPVIHSFIHSGHFYKSITTQRRSRLQHGYCIGVSRRSAQETVSKGLAQGPYVAARAGVESTTLQLSHRLNQCATTSHNLCCVMLTQHRSFKHMPKALCPNPVIIRGHGGSYSR